MITVDSRQGIVYRGRLEPIQPHGERPSAAEAAAPHARPAVTVAPPLTTTRLYVNLGQPELAEQVAREAVEGVGLLRIEFMVLAITNNTHPRKLLQEGRGDEFRDRLADNLALFARAFAPRPVVARTTDFRTNEYRNMAGGAAFEHAAAVARAFSARLTAVCIVEEEQATSEELRSAEERLREWLPASADAKCWI